MIQQVVLSRAEVCTILGNAVAGNFSEGTKVNASVVMWGKHQKRRSMGARTDIASRYLHKTTDDDDLRLVDLGAVVTLTKME